MTPEMRALQITESFKGGKTSTTTVAYDVLLQEKIADAIRAAIAEERKACAWAAVKAFEEERLWENRKDGADVLLAAIRDRELAP